MQHQQATAQKYEAFTFAMLLPYLQGTLLYVLALTFPFFALMILVPGKAGSFFMWMAGWLWLKSWDLGWAFVMVIDDVLWNLMPHSSVYDPHRDPNHGPASIFESAFNGDMSYSLTGYYSILGVLMTAVPLITGRIILGGKFAIGGALIKGLSGLAQSLGGAASDWVAVGQVYKMDALKEMMNYDYAMAHSNTYATPALRDNHNRIKYDAYEGMMFQDFGQKLSYAGLAGGGAALLGGGLALGGLSAIGLGVGLSTFKTGVGMQQTANERMPELRLQNASVHSFEFANTREFTSLETNRGQISGRMEHWGVPDVPWALQAENQKSFENQDTDMATDQSTMFGKTIRQFLTRGE
jgi:hypothetical protein